MSRANNACQQIKTRAACTRRAACCVHTYCMQAGYTCCELHTHVLRATYTCCELHAHVLQAAYTCCELHHVLRAACTRAARFLDGFKKANHLYEFISEVILKIDFVWDVKTSEKFIKNYSERVFTTCNDTHSLNIHYEWLMDFWIGQFDAILWLKKFLITQCWFASHAHAHPEHYLLKVVCSWRNDLVTNQNRETNKNWIIIFICPVLAALL